jgi:hypothetical protein
MMQGEGLSPAFAGLGGWAMQGQMRAALQDLRGELQAVQDPFYQVHLKILAAQRTGKQGYFFRPESKGIRGPGGQYGQRLKGLGQGTQAHLGLRVAKVMTQIALGI